MKLKDVHIATILMTAAPFLDFGLLSNLSYSILDVAFETARLKIPLNSFWSMAAPVVS